MIRPLFLLMSGLISLLLLGGFRCEPYCDNLFELRDWQSAWINNSGSDPVITTDPIPRSALGIRLSATLLNLDSLAVSDNEDCTWNALHPISTIEVFATDAFDTVAIGENISSRFRLRAMNAYSFDYLTLEEALGQINFFYAPVAPDYQIDLLMTEPPSQAGSYRFTVKIQFDSIFMPPILDTLFTLPTVILQ
jgi:hypothetical protein